MPELQYIQRRFFIFNPIALHLSFVITAAIAVTFGCILHLLLCRALGLHVSETEKYAHVTFFFNGGREAPYEGEERILVPSPKVATYDLQPEMSAYEVKDKLVAEIKEGILADVAPTILRI